MHRPARQPAASPARPAPAVDTITPTPPLAPQARETPGLDHQQRHARFRAIVADHLDAAHNLAWWLTRHEHDAADVVQESCLKALRAFDAYRGGDPKSWFLAIVRNAARTRLRARAAAPLSLTSLDDVSPPAPPDAALRLVSERLSIAEALAKLPEAFREIIVLKDMEGLSYAQIALILEIPLGTVMSRLSRARDAARVALSARPPKDEAL